MNFKNEIEETYLWSHEPYVSSPPVLRLEHILWEGPKQEIDEMAVFKLDNGKFLFIRFYGTKTDLSVGCTDLEEFDSFEEAKELYEQFFLKEEIDE